VSTISRNNKYLGFIRTINFILIMSLASIGIASLGIMINVILNYSLLAIPWLISPEIIRGATATILNGVYLGILLIALIQIVRNYLEQQTEYRLILDLVSIQIAVTLILSFLDSKVKLAPSPLLVPALVLWAPILEELFFRGFLVGIPCVFRYGKARMFFGGIRKKNFFTGLLAVVSAIIFSIPHMYLGFLGVVNAFVAGIILAYIFIDFGLLESIFAHFILNAATAFSIAIIFLPIKDLVVPLLLVGLILLMIGSMGAILVLISLYRRIRRIRSF